MSNGRGLDQLQHALDTNDLSADWPADVCRDAWCGLWERNDGQYFWHRAHTDGGDQPETASLWPDSRG